MTVMDIIDLHPHLSELAIDRLLAGELPARDAASLEHHARACADCAAALADARAVQREVAAGPTPIWIAPRRRAWRPRLAGAAIGLAAACALLLVRPRHDDIAGAGTRAKGTAIVGFFVAHGDAVRRGATREAVMPGDRVELFTTTSAPAWFAAISSDGSVYIEPRQVAPGREQVVPGAIELDGALRDELVTGVFCPAPFDARAIDLAAPPAGCSLDHFTLVKVPR